MLRRGGAALSQPHPRHLRLRSHPPLDAELTYQHQETNFTLGLAELNARLKRRALVILFTDFVDTITAELLIESMQRVANRHVVVFVTQRGSVLQGAVEATPTQFTDVAQSVVAHDFLRERSIVFERLERLGVHASMSPAAACRSR